MNSARTPVDDALGAGVVESYRRDRFALFDADGGVHLDGRGDVPYDEFVDADGAIRPHWSELVEAYARSGESGLSRTGTRLSAMIADEGITYTPVGGSPGMPATPVGWQLDSVPLVLDGDTWATVEAGVAQRCRLLDALLADLYGPQRTIESGLVAPEMVFGHPGWIPKVAAGAPAGARSLFLHAADLGRLSDGSVAVWGDYAGAPSGVGYAMADRRLVSRVLAGPFGRVVPRPITSFAAAMRVALVDAAPTGVDDPTIVVLSPGSLSETYFDQVAVSSQLGVPLVEGSDLLVRNGALYMRSLGSFKRVDVVLRRVDAAWCDPLDLRTDSRLGVAGLVEAVARGAVTVVNTLGAGVVENPALHTVAAELATALLDEELILRPVETWWAGDPLGASEIRRRVADLVVDNVRTGERHIGAVLDAAARDQLCARIDADSWQWVGRAVPDFSVSPSSVGWSGRGTSRLRPAPVSVRTFAVAHGTGYTVMPGGLGQVLADGAAGAAMSSVAAKDVWVVAPEPAGDARVTETSVAVSVPSTGAAIDRSALSPRVLADLFWLGRYGERTEATVRMVRVASERHQAQRFRPRAEDTAVVTRYLAGVGAATGTSHLVDGASDDLTSVLAAMTTARTVPGTIAHALDRLASSARAVRDQMSTSTWMVLGTVERAMAELRESTPVDLSDLALGHERMLHGMLALSGLQADSMVHDPGWVFMDAGRRLERIVLVCELLRGIAVDRADPDVEQGLLEAFLVANESAVIYRRRNRGVLRLRSVIMLSVLDETNPRSVIYQLDALHDDWDRLPDEVRSAGVERTVADLVADVRRVEVADLVDTDDTGVRRDLDRLLSGLSEGARSMSDLLGRTRFAPPRDLQPLWGGARSQLP
ncbi:circularly permuted type 2 ATP-grasp protein [Williamsia sp. SKLECPSW1]